MKGEEIKVVHNPDEATLTKMGVRDWPTWGCDVSVKKKVMMMWGRKGETHSLLPQYGLADPGHTLPTGVKVPMAL